MTQLATVITCLDSPRLAKECTKWLRENSDPAINTIILLDNGSYEPLEKFDADMVFRFARNEGANTIIHDMIPHLKVLAGKDVEIVAYLHCDLMIREKGWDHRIIKEFDQDPKLALAGFVGSNQFDGNGGRGAGTVLNYQGYNYPEFGQATAARQHGEAFDGTRPVGVLDHCSLIFRIEQLKQLVPQRGHYAPGHFYDRILCCQVLLKAWHILYIGIACDHFSGGTAEGVPNMLEYYTEWLIQEGIALEANIDTAVYNEAQSRFFKEFKENKKVIPCLIKNNFTITRL